MNKPNIFIPTNQRSQEEVVSESSSSTVTVIKNTLTILMQLLVVAGIGLVPLLFMYTNQNPPSFDRVFLTTLIAGAALVIGAIILLFKKQLTTVRPISLLFLALFVLWGIISAMVQGDSYDSIWGVKVEQLTVAFSVLLLVYACLPLLLQSSTKMMMRAFGLISIVALIAMVHTVLWYWFGFSWLDLGQLTTAHQSLVGGFNDSAIYAGLIVIFSLTTLIMLPLRRYVQLAVSVLVALAMFVLLLVNFNFVWFALAIVSIVTTGYVCLRKLLFQSVPVSPIGIVAKTVSFLVLIISLFAVFYGSGIVEKLSENTNAQFVEVRPSVTASLDVVSGVYQEDLLLGVGPNRFEDAWRQHKDTSINELVLWDTDFSAGYGHMLSVFATYGLVGGLLLVLFQLSFLWFGVSRLTRDIGDNTFARYVTTTTFVGAVFLWVMTYIYIPSTTLMLLAASLTGLTFATSAVLDGTKKISIATITNRKRGFVVLFVVVISIVLVIASVNAVTDKYYEQADVQEGVETNNDEIIGQLADIRIIELGEFIATANPESVDQESLLTLSKAALITSKEAVSLDPTNPRHLERLASLYTLLGAVGVDGGYLNAKQILDDVIVVDPKNPKHHLASARVLVADGNIEEAKVALANALELKQNYTEAIRLEIDIVITNGEVEETLDRIDSILQLNPDIAPRLYQLGVLHATVDNTEEAIGALLQALQIDPAYADARYILALQYLATDRQSEALSQLNLIKKTNPDNEQIQSLIESVENGEEIGAGEQTPSFPKPAPVVDSESGVSVPSEVPTDLITPVN